MSAARTFVVIPAFHEERQVGAVVRGVRQRLPEAKVVVVDDGSRDGTASAALQAGASVIRMPVNSGYGVALQTGLIWARRHEAEVVITMDADGQHDAAETPKILAPVLSGEADLVLGSRYLNHGAGYRVSFLRRLGSRFFAVLVSRLIGQRITDPTTGFQAMNAKALELYVNLREFPEQTPDANLIVYASLRHCRIVEAPVVMHADQGPSSMHGGLGAVFYVPRMLISIASVLFSARGA